MNRYIIVCLLSSFLSHLKSIKIAFIFRDHSKCHCYCSFCNEQIRGLTVRVFFLICFAFGHFSSPPLPNHLITFSVVIMCTLISPPRSQISFYNFLRKCPFFSRQPFNISLRVVGLVYIYLLLKQSQA